MNRLFYRVAEQYFAIEGASSSEIIRQALGKYAPFECAKDPGEEAIALRVFIDDQIALSDGSQPLEVVSEPSFRSESFRTSQGDYYIRLKSGREVVEGLISKDWTTLRLKGDWYSARSLLLIDRMIMIAFTQAILPLGYLKVHASVVELQGEALVFMGVSGTGKSTHSRLWLECEPQGTLLNDDEPIVRIAEEVLVYGCPWSGSTPCYRNEHASIRAFVHLYQATENEMRKLSGRGAFEALFSSCTLMPSDPYNKRRVFDLVCQALERIPVYRLDNKPDAEAVALTRSLLA